MFCALARWRTSVCFWRAISAAVLPAEAAAAPAWSRMLRASAVSCSCLARARSACSTYASARLETTRKRSCRASMESPALETTA